MDVLRRWHTIGTDPHLGLQRALSVNAWHFVAESANSVFPSEILLSYRGAYLIRSDANYPGGIVEFLRGRVPADAR